MAPPAREWNHIGSDVILAEDLERLVVWRASLVNEIVDALLPGYQFFPLLKRGLAFEYKRRQALRSSIPRRCKTSCSKREIPRDPCAIGRVRDASRGAGP
jgi:hypothetical protein